MNVLSKFWNNFKFAPDVWFFYGFLLTFTLSIRKVLFFYPIAGQFNEWTGIYLYLSDVFLVITFFLWGVSILQNKSVKLSIDSVKLWLKQAKIYLPLLLVIWSLVSIFWSGNQNIALFKAIKLLELYFLYLYVIYQIIPQGTFLRNTFRIIIILGLFQAIIGTWQFLAQNSIGLFWLKESLISPNIPGVAKIVFNGEKFIRAYGLFPHPNILGGFLLVSIILTWAYYKMFHVEHSQSCHSYHSEESSYDSSEFISAGWRIRMAGILLVQFIALILTFSKSAIIGLFVALLYILWKNKGMFCDCPVSHHSGIYGMERLDKKVIIIAIILILSLYLAGLNFGENLEKSYGDRLDQLAVWRSVSQNNLLLGSGIGSYLFHVKHLYPNLETWQYQPIHNVFLLILAELGFVGVFIFFLFLWKLFRVEQLCCYWSGTIFKGILIAFIFIMLFDHYFWDIQQGQIMLWIVLGFVIGYKRESCEQVVNLTK